MAVRAGFTSIIIILVATLCSACTSAPIDMSAGADGEQAELRTEQAELRERADALADLVDARGWSVSAEPGEAARALLGRLIGGASSNDPTESSVERYLSDHEAPGQAAAGDLQRLTARTRELTELTLAVAGAEGRLGQASLARDIADSERALGAVRRASAFFEAVQDAVQAETGEAADDDVVAVRAELADLAAAEAALARGADALAERRWAMRSGLFS